MKTLAPPTQADDDFFAFFCLPDNLRHRLAFANSEDCWVWTGRLNRNGYGRAWDARRKCEPVAHRLVYELTRGPIPPGLVLDHTCRNRRCCNPAHLEPVSCRVNTLRGEAVLYGRPSNHYRSAA